jgi:hypothetical protein
MTCVAKVGSFSFRLDKVRCLRSTQLLAEHAAFQVARSAMNGKIKLAAGRETLMLMLMEEDFLDLMESPLATRELQTTTCNQLSIRSLQEPCS